MIERHPTKCGARMVRWVLALAVATLPLLLPAQSAPPRPALKSPSVLDDGWEVQSAEAAGFDGAALAALLARMMNGETNLHGVIVERGGRLVAEEYRRGPDRSVYSLFARATDFGPTVRHDTRSIGKSVISLLLGIAQQQGKLGALDVPALDCFPELADLATPERRAITLDHFLTMSSGQDWSEGGPGTDHEHRLYWKWSPVRYVFERPRLAAPGAKFNYHSGGTAVLAEVLTRVTGIPWREYAREQLFAPLGIADWEWVGDVYGRPMSFVGLRMRPRDLAKLGRLVLGEGKWRGRSIVPAEWIAASLQPRIATGIRDFQYGRHWWCGTVAWQGRALAWNAAFGNGGQRLFLVPELNLSVVIAAGAYGDAQAPRRVFEFFQELVSTVREVRAAGIR